MRIDFVSRTVHDVDAAAVAFPARNSSGKMLVGVGDAPVVFFFVFVLFGVRSGVAAQPELLNKVVALFVVGELLKGGSFLVGDNPDYVLVQPLLVGLAEFDVQSSFLLFLLLFRWVTLERIDLIRRLRLRASRVRGWCFGGRRTRR